MESKMIDAMTDCWKNLHKSDNATQGFIEGFEACHDLLMPLLEMSAPHVFASAVSEHLTDGFRPRRHPIDELVERIKAVIPDE